MGALRTMRRRRIGALDVRRRVMDRYNRRIQAAMAGTVWTAGCTQLLPHARGQGRHAAAVQRRPVLAADPRSSGCGGTHGERCMPAGEQLRRDLVDDRLGLVPRRVVGPWMVEHEVGEPDRRVAARRSRRTRRCSRAAAPRCCRSCRCARWSTDRVRSRRTRRRAGGSACGRSRPSRGRAVAVRRVAEGDPRVAVSGRDRERLASAGRDRDRDAGTWTAAGRMHASWTV